MEAEHAFDAIDLNRDGVCQICTPHRAHRHVLFRATFMYYLWFTIISICYVLSMHWVELQYERADNLTSESSPEHGCEIQ